MHKGKYVFSQLLDFIEKDVFLRLANKYGGNRYVKNFTCWNQLAVLMFGQLSNRGSLREVVLSTQALADKAYPLGFGKYAAKSTLADANNNRDYRIFEEFAYHVIAKARECRATVIFKLGGNVYAFDSTAVDLCLSVFEWALFRRKKGGVKVHDTKAMDLIPYEENSFYIFDLGYNDFARLFRINAIGSYFIVRGKKNNDFKPVKWTRRFPVGSGILSDAVGYMNGDLTRGKYPEMIRRIIYWDEEQQRKFIFFTNAPDISPMMVAELCHNRWQIVFFKLMKQHLRIKKFWETTENAVRIQIYSAMTAYCMMAIVQKKLRIKRPIYEMLQLASISLTETTPLEKLFGKPNYNVINELDGSTEPTLF